MSLRLGPVSISPVSYAKNHSNKPKLGFGDFTVEYPKRDLGDAFTKSYLVNLELRDLETKGTIKYNFKPVDDASDTYTAVVKGRTGDYEKSTKLEAYLSEGIAAKGLKTTPPTSELKTIAEDAKDIKKLFAGVEEVIK